MIDFSRAENLIERTIAVYEHRAKLAIDAVSTEVVRLMAMTALSDDPELMADLDAAKARLSTAMVASRSTPVVTSNDVVWPDVFPMLKPTKEEDAADMANPNIAGIALHDM